LLDGKGSFAMSAGGGNRHCNAAEGKITLCRFVHCAFRSAFVGERARLLYPPRAHDIWQHGDLSLIGLD
jgi:hypothetical protein